MSNRITSSDKSQIISTVLNNKTILGINPITGATLQSNQVVYASSATTVTSSTGLTYDGTTSTSADMKVPYAQYVASGFSMDVGTRYNITVIPRFRHGITGTFSTPSLIIFPTAGIYKVNVVSILKEWKQVQLI